MYVATSLKLDAGVWCEADVNRETNIYHLVVSLQVRVARFTSTQQLSGSIPTSEGGQIHLNQTAIW